MPTFDEANARITEELTGRTIDHVIRNGLELELVCVDGHVVVIQATIEGHIVHKKTDVRVTLQGVDMFPLAGRL